ncbi:MAG: hypothetical protein ACE5HY_06015 [Candidatus Hydrothermarchaeales archaeon]
MNGFATCPSIGTADLRQPSIRKEPLRFGAMVLFTFKSKRDEANRSQLATALAYLTNLREGGN